MLIRRLAVIGLGLIGGSLARALREAGAVGEVVGCGRNPAQLARALELGVADRTCQDPAEAVAGADVVLLSVPVGSMEAIFARIAGHLAPSAVLTDAGSTKASVVAAAVRAFGAVPPNFVPGHPIAGTERSGVEAAFAELYRQRRVILTPLDHTDRRAVTLVTRMWQAAGAVVEEMGVEHHDEVLAATSHLPHLLAFSLVDTLAQMEERTEIFRYAAGGFRDFTRIASSDPQMWHDISMENRAALLKVLAQFRSDLDRLAEAIRDGESDYVLELFQRAKAARDRFANLTP